ncbi:hypothetical protein C0J52_16935 [Blattella germanica]|nr:hypothetical protein C0J52_16935 [Blattella germanica]
MLWIPQKAVVTTITMFHVFVLVFTTITLVVSLEVDVPRYTNLLRVPTQVENSAVKYYEETKSDHQVVSSKTDDKVNSNCSNSVGTSTIAGHLVSCEELQSENSTASEEIKDAPNSEVLDQDYGSDVGEERAKKTKLKRTLIKMALALKMVAVGFILPGVVALSMLHSWKAVTISLMALGLALIIGIKNLVKASSSSSTQPQPVTQILPVTWPPTSHQHYWRNVRQIPEPYIVDHHDYHEHGPSSHDLAYRRYFVESSLQFQQLVESHNMHTSLGHP